MSKPPENALRPRRCKYCKALFTPKRIQDWKARFCEPNHRKAYHKYGSLPFDKLLTRVRTEMQGEIATFMAPTMRAISELIERVNALEAATHKRRPASHAR